jgi:hypothetical protein
MSDLPISQLPLASIATGSNVLPIVQGGVTDQITVTDLGKGIFNLNLPLTSSGILVTGSVNISGSTLQSGNNTLVGNTVLSGSIEVSGSTNFRNSSFTVTGSQYFSGSSQFIGNQQITGSLDITGTLTFSGSLFVNGNKQFNYGNFYSTQSQTNPIGNVSHSMYVETNAGSVGVTVVSQSRMTVQNTGTYNLQFSTQFEKTSNGVDTAYVWFKKNGINIVDSATSLDIAKQAGGGCKCPIRSSSLAVIRIISKQAGMKSPKGGCGFRSEINSGNQKAYSLIFISQTSYLIPLSGMPSRLACHWE